MRLIFKRIGRRTICEIVSKRTGEIFEGASKCHKTDQFFHVIGEEIAKARAIINMNKKRLSRLKAKRKLLKKELADIEYRIRVSEQTTKNQYRELDRYYD